MKLCSRTVCTEKDFLCPQTISCDNKSQQAVLQMEKRLDIPEEADNVDRCRRVLQRGLSLNPTDAKLLQVSLSSSLQTNCWSPVYH